MSGSATLESTATISHPATSAAKAQATKRDEALRTSKIMIVDDEPMVVKVVQTYLKHYGYENSFSTTDPEIAIEMVEAHKPDVLLLDVMMPGISGLEILASLRADDRWALMPIVVFTASSDTTLKRQALELGATEFLAKPVDPTDLVPRIKTVLTVKRHYDHLQRYSEELEAEVRRRTADLAWSRWETRQCLARLADIRDDDTGHHVHRVGRYAALIATEMGWSPDRVEILEQAAQLHDIGKIAISELILLKPDKMTRDDIEIKCRYAGETSIDGSPLSEMEQNLLDEHTRLGSRLLTSMKSPILNMAAVVSLTHHERWDGLGYPAGLSGDAIPIEGRITAVADFYETLSASRPPRASFPSDRCFAVINDEHSKRFDPVVVDAMMRARDKIVHAQHEMADSE